eukprot:12931785-Prorocentrum_lima.AAC.1
MVRVNIEEREDLKDKHSDGVEAVERLKNTLAMIPPEALAADSQLAKYVEVGPRFQHVATESHWRRVIEGNLRRLRAL